MSPAQATLRRCKVYRQSFPMTEVALPASSLRNREVARWVRNHRMVVDVRSGEDLAVAIAAGVHPARMTVHVDGMGDSDLRAIVNLVPGRIAVSSMAQIAVLTTAVDQTQGIVIRVTDGGVGLPFDSTELEAAVDMVVADKCLSLVGLHGDVGGQTHDFVSYPAAIGHMVTAMGEIRWSHKVLLTRLGLGGGRAVPSGDWAVELPCLATQIDESLDAACATMRYPRPLVAISPGAAIVGQVAA